MAVYTPEQLFESAKNAHGEICGMIDEIVGILNKAGNYQATTKDLVTYVDVILQVCLLNGAFADGQIETNELIFIKNIAKSTDALIPINNALMQANKNWSYIEWEGLPLASEEKQRAIVASSISVVKPFVDAFVDFMAVEDKAITDKDYLEEFTKRFSTIFITLGGIDGDDLSADAVRSEGSIAFACYKALVVDKWKRKTGLNFI